MNDHSHEHHAQANKEAHRSCCTTHGHQPKNLATEAPAGTIYVCPMHPQIRQVGPGSCPICGMALEPEVMTGEEGSKPRADRHDPPFLGWRCF
jgi:Cu+-exporting ATPase